MFPDVEYTLLQVIMRTATIDPAWYDSKGGDHTLYAVGATPNSPVGMVTGGTPTNPNVGVEQTQKQNAMIVATNALDNLQDLMTELRICKLVDNIGQPLWNPSHDLQMVAVGFQNGASISDCQFALYKVGYGKWSQRNRVILSVLSRYTAAMGNSDAPGVTGSEMSAWLNDVGIAHYYIEAGLYLNPRTGLVGPLVQGVPLVNIGNQRVWVPIDGATATSITTQLVAMRPLPRTPPVDWLDQVSIEANPPPGEGVASPYAQYVGAGIGSYYLWFAYSLSIPNNVDAGMSLLEMEVSELDRFKAVVIEGNALLQKCRRASSKFNMCYTFQNLITKEPQDPIELLNLTPANSPYIMCPDFPTRLATWFIIGYGGMNPFKLSSQGGLSAYTPDYNGSPKTSEFGLDPAYIVAHEQMWRAKVAWWACNGGYQFIDFSQDAPNTPTEWGSLLYYPLNPDKTRALIWFADNSQYGDLAGALNGGLVTDIQLANVFQLAIASDPSFAQQLGLVPGVNVGDHNAIDPASVDAQFSANFYKNPNNMTMRDAWLRVTIQSTTTTPPGTVTPVPFGPLQPPNITIGTQAGQNPPGDTA